MTRTSERYTRLLWAYPRAYRKRRGEEIHATLLDAAAGQSTGESLRNAVDVIGHGLRLRLGIASDQVGGRVLATAALSGMTIAAAAAMTLPLFAQLLPGIHHDPSSFGPDTAIWPGLCVLWILGAFAAVAFPRRKRVFVLACVVATLATAALLPPRSGYLLSAFCLLIALAVPSLLAPRTSPSRSHRTLALVVGAVVLATLVTSAQLKPGLSYGGPFFYWSLGPLAPYVVGAVMFCSVVLLVTRRWLHAMALTIVAVPWMVFPLIDQQWLGVAATGYLVAIEIACAIGVGLLGERLSHLKGSPEAAH